MAWPPIWKNTRNGKSTPDIRTLAAPRPADVQHRLFAMPRVADRNATLRANGRVSCSACRAHGLGQHGSRASELRTNPVLDTAEIVHLLQRHARRSIASHESDGADGPAVGPPVTDLRAAAGGAPVLIKVSACGVCRTDLHVVDGELPDGQVAADPRARNRRPHHRKRGGVGAFRHGDRSASRGWGRSVASARTAARAAKTSAITRGSPATISTALCRIHLAEPTLLFSRFPIAL